ncbi:ThiF family adenylyltransferase [Hymenobacter sp. UV11]|uniref:HesA/MoeB/ThiF family protein n=1 Tax=Hymenobacter sp. UV11 TaxID=1849735 RepID=UPI001060C0BC|nr:ThiF family adenylyltransferase [Hymenobacter sp. UV11]TDN36787.1 hypothetical protein A8B98_07290 [Hymenobacter sp. UV11]TFZ63680.1 ThiF family adenylyltransferase [Hymenobacter sp. UV11]
MSKFDAMALAQARSMLAHTAGVDVLGEWRKQSKSAAWLLRLRLKLEAEPTAAVPLYSEWEVAVNFDADEWGKVQIYPALGPNGLTVTFQHQQFNGARHATWECRSGHVCSASWSGGLAKQRNALPVEPTTTAERICWHVVRVLEWLPQAATNILAKPGDVYELPDFAIGGKTLGNRLVYLENEESFALWQQDTNTSGIAWLSNSPETNTLYVRSFLPARGKQAIYTPPWGQVVASKKKDWQALWIRLNEMPVVGPWQAPATTTELAQALTAQGKNLADMLEPLWKNFELTGAQVMLLVGVPIPRKIGEDPYRYHWQALQLFPITKAPPKSRLALVKAHLASAHPLTWLQLAENWDAAELQNRGRLPQALCEAKVLLLGAGALGSNLSVQLVHMGVQHLTVVDGEKLEGGNLVRHTLGFEQLTQPKALALAEQLRQANPLAHVVGIDLMLPKTSAEFEQAASEATLILDATAEDAVLRMIPLACMNLDALFVSCSLSLRAEQLFFYAEMAGQFEQAKFDEWYAPYRLQQNELAEQIDLPRGIGCYNPLTPAPLNRIAGLGSVAVELLEQVYGQPISLPVSLSHNWRVPLLVPATEEVFP